MAWPQLYPHLGEGSQWSPRRLFKGTISPHIGRDQRAGNGAERLAPADGVVLGHGQTEKYGYWIAVRYDGSPAIERQHQTRKDGRRPLGRFKKGDVLAVVGQPHLYLLEAVRRRMADWSGGAKWSSTGSHSHQEIRIGGTTEAHTVDPAGPEAAREWAKVLAHQTPKPAVSASRPLAPNLLEQHMPVIYVIDGSTVYAFDTASGKKRKLGATEWRFVRRAYAAAGVKLPETTWA